MSETISTAFIQQYRANVMLLSQQKKSRLRDCVVVDTDVTGKAAYFDQLDSFEAEEITNRFGDSPVSNPPHKRRRVTPRGFDYGVFLDDFDKVKILIDPTSSYVEAGAAALGRKLDQLVLEAALGTAYTGEDGSTPVTLPAGQVVAVNSAKFGGSGANSGLTIPKLREIRNIMGINEADDYDEMGKPNLFIACTQTEITNLLQTTEATSRDFTPVQALYNGDVDYFMGFRFKRTNKIAKSGANNRVVAWAKTGIKVGIWSDLEVDIVKRTDKRMAWYAYGKMYMDATRMEEVKVVECLCDPTA